MELEATGHILGSVRETRDMPTAFKLETTKTSTRRAPRKSAKKLGDARNGGMSLGLKRQGARKLGSIDIPPEFRERISTGYEAMDLFLSDGGGICPIQAISITAPRGGGKTTLFLQIIQGMYSATNGNTEGLYGSGEEYVEQLGLTAERVGAYDVSADNLTKIEDYIEEMESGKWKMIVVDSVPSLTTGMRILDGELVRKEDVSAAEWKTTTAVPKSQLENLAVQTLTAAAKKHKTPVVFILHLTKDGKVKGDSAIEHTVDTCLEIIVPKEKEIEEGLIPYGAKLIRNTKNRFGGTGTVCFKMGAKGWDLDNPIDLAGMKAPENEKKNMGGERAEKKVREMKAILERMKAIGKPASVPEIINPILPDDATAFDRHERHIKAMVKMGKVIKNGGGKGFKGTITYELAPAD